MVSIRHTTRVHGPEVTAHSRQGHGGLGKRGHVVSATVAWATVVSATVVWATVVSATVVSAMVVLAMVVLATVVSTMVLGHAVHTRALSVSCAMCLLQRQCGSQ